jgi:hypothetical protein
MRKSILALVIGGILATGTYSSASAETTTIVRDRPSNVVIVKRKPAKKVVFVRDHRPSKKVVIVKERKRPRVVHVRPAGSRTVIVRRPGSQVAVIRRD